MRPLRPLDNGMIHDCRIDPERLALLRECMETYGQEGHARESEWPWNVLSTRAVAYSCGALARDGESIIHNHDASEFEFCKKLALEAAQIIAEREVGMGNEGECEFSPYYV